MIECSGVCYFNTAEAVTGRLCAVGSARHSGTNVAQILIWDGKGDLGEALSSSAVGVVFPNDLSEHDRQRAARLAHFCRLPALGIDLPREIGANSIAILDSAGSKLYVNPDLETINSYFGVRARESAHRPRYLLETKHAVSISDTQFRGLVTGRQTGADEQGYYEHLCDLADTNTGAELVALADAADADAFVRDVRAIYRAGVWGRVSLLCTSVHTPTRAKECVLRLHDTFRALENEEREFNGFIRKGLLVDTPMLLFCEPMHSVVDFFCIDFEHVRHLASGSPDTAVGESETARYVEEFASLAQGSRIFLRGTRNVSKERLVSLLERVSVSGIYTK